MHEIDYIYSTNIMNGDRPDRSDPIEHFISTFKSCIEVFISNYVTYRTTVTFQIMQYYIRSVTSDLF